MNKEILLEPRLEQELTQKDLELIATSQALTAQDLKNLELEARVIVLEGGKA